MTLYVGGLLGDTQRALMRCATPNTNVWRAYVAVGATGAPTVTTSTDAAGGAIGVTRNTTGVYDITFPVLAAVGTSIPSIRAWILQSATPTVAQAFPKAFAPTSGTAQIVTALNAAGTPVDPANGDSFMVEIVAASTVA
jgi:hypothetical protein